jgi:hypothetical protein
LEIGQVCEVSLTKNLRAKLDYDGSFDSSDTVSAPSCAVVVVISVVLVICIACQLNPINRNNEEHAIEPTGRSSYRPLRASSDRDLQSEVISYLFSLIRWKNQNNLII